jgi:hypothetical protein
MKRQTAQKIIENGTYDTPKYRYIAEHYVFETAIKRIERKHLGTDATKSDCGPYNPNGWKTVARISNK